MSKPVGATGLEPMTSCTPCKRATRLRHAPLIEISIAKAASSSKCEFNAPFVNILCEPYENGCSRLAVHIYCLNKCYSIIPKHLGEYEELLSLIIGLVKLSPITNHGHHIVLIVIFYSDHRSWKK